MKRIIGILLAAVMVFGALGLTSCGSEDKAQKVENVKKKDAEKGKKHQIPEKPEKPEKTSDKKKLSINDEALWGIGKNVAQLNKKYGTVIDSGWFYGAYIKFDDDRAYGLNSADSLSISDSDLCVMIYTGLEDLFGDGDRFYTMDELKGLLGECTINYNEMDGEYLYTFDYKDYEIIIRGIASNITYFKDESVDVWSKSR